jgi:hypothetical protein
MKDGIIAQNSMWSPEAYRKKKEEIRLRVTIQYASEYAKASWWGKLMIDMKVSYVVRREMAKAGARV